MLICFDVLHFIDDIAYCAVKDSLYLRTENRVSIQTKHDRVTDLEVCLVHLFSTRCVLSEFSLSSCISACWYFMVLAVYCFHGTVHLYFLGCLPQESRLRKSGSVGMITVVAGCGSPRLMAGVPFLTKRR